MKQELFEILNRMDIPEMRKGMRDEDLQWLRRNIQINNSNHPEIRRALILISQLQGR